MSSGSAILTVLESTLTSNMKSREESVLLGVMLISSFERKRKDAKQEKCQRIAIGKKRRATSRTGGQRGQNEEIPQKKDETGRKRTAKKIQEVGHVVTEGPEETTDISSSNESEDDARAFPSFRHDPLYKNFEIANNSIDFTPSQESSIHDTVGKYVPF
ncbi:unnamed protein product [Mytilus edulis]|uniref:Uncharacterized protein n=1 Tax=Mytilus edulis TaxID=6550 RepID=A0A8S3PZ82_MYTED|nr:unnamed protein product [Mytilus edulis]